MNQIKEFIRSYSYIIYPIIFTLFPLVSFYGSNKSEIESGGFNPLSFLFFNIIVGAACWGVSFLLIRNIKKASLFAVGLMLIFFNLGRVISSLGTFSIQMPLTTVGPTKLSLGLSLLFLIGLFVVVRKLKSEETVEKVSQNLVFISFAMLIIAALPLLSGGSSSKSEQAESNQPAVASNTDESVLDTKPDIYYILLDGYARADFYKEKFDYDNSDFLNQLEKRGFYVAEKSHSNYAHTHFSVPSTFNMKYLDDVIKQQGEESNDRKPLRDLTVNNEVINIFKSFGYSYIQNGSQWGWTEKSPHADILVEAGKEEKKILGMSLNEFSNVYLQTTALKPWIAASIRDELVVKTLGAFEKTEKVPEYKEPTLTFTHIVSPHPPYLFNADGIIPGLTKTELDNDGFSDRDKYVEQTKYVNKRILEVIDNLFSKSETKPIIILASDHGPASDLKRSDFQETDMKKFNAEGIRERMGNLNAYYFPDSNYKKLYPTITPVNSFRLILDQYFKQNYPLLPDKSYFSNNKANEYRMFDVTEMVAGNE